MAALIRITKRLYLLQSRICQLLEQAAKSESRAERAPAHYFDRYPDRSPDNLLSHCRATQTSFRAASHGIDAACECSLTTGLNLSAGSSLLAGGSHMPDIDFIRAEIQRMRSRVLRRRGEIRQLQRAGIPSSSEALLEKMLKKIDQLRAERDNPKAALGRDGPRVNSGLSRMRLRAVVPAGHYVLIALRGRAIRNHGWRWPCSKRSWKPSWRLRPLAPGP
jgi:hypothetical protein